MNENTGNGGCGAGPYREGNDYVMGAQIAQEAEERMSEEIDGEYMEMEEE